MKGASLPVPSAIVAGVAALGALAILLVPDQAWAWGPLAHLDFSSNALQSLHLLPQGTRLLLGKCASEFLYGSLAADIIVGKNLARYGVHCHNWKVGWKVFDRARGEPQQAFALGFLAHLAADTVAHNYYVPYKTVQGYPVRSTGHAYWELRYDRMLGPELWRTARRVTRTAFRRHDEFLEEALAGSYVIPFGVSRRMFDQFLNAAKARRWQALSSVYARERRGHDLSLVEEEVNETRRLAVGQIVGLLSEREQSGSNLADPTGGRNLHLAFELRQRLLRATNREGLQPEEARGVVLESRAAFRDAIEGKVRIPAIPTASLSTGARELLDGARHETDQHADAELELETEEAEEAAGPVPVGLVSAG